MELIANELIKVAGAGVLAFLMVLIRKYAARVDAQTDGHLQATLEALARQGVLQAEEWAAAQVKAKGIPLSQSKLDMAIQHVLSAAPRATEAQARAAVLAALPTLGMGATVGRRK